MKNFSNLTTNGFGFAVKEIWREHQNILLIVNDKSELAKLRREIKFLIEEAEVHILPSWDSLPYDKVSPSREIIVKRIETISSIENSRAKKIVLADSLSIMQYLPPKGNFQTCLVNLRVGQEINRDNLIKSLIEIGYERVNNATEHNQFALRGGIIDIIPPEQIRGWRIDFFGDNIERIRSYDPVTQLSGETAEVIKLIPAHEIIFHPENIALFKANYRKIFGLKSMEDPLYESVSDKRFFPGLEYYISLFYEKMDNIFEYFKPSLILMDEKVDQGFLENERQIYQYYQERRELENDLSHNSHLIDPSSLWLKSSDIRTEIAKFKTIICHSSEAINANDNRDFGFKKIDNSMLEKYENLSNNDKLLNLLTYWVNEKNDGKFNLLCCNSLGSRERFKTNLKKIGIKSEMVNSFNEIIFLKNREVGLIDLPISCSYETDKYRFFSEEEFFGTQIINNRRIVNPEEIFKQISNLVEGEAVVHKEHGVAKFLGLKTIEIEKIMLDFLVLEYQNQDKLYVPVQNIELVSRYGGEEAEYDKLGGSNWQTRKARVKRKINEIARNLVEIAALRSEEKAQNIMVVEEIYQKFSEKFPYEETPDQLRSITEVKKDLSLTKPMDRLICGDVGFGKTEVAMRAACMAFYSVLGEGEKLKQIALVAPTTLLAKQHYNNFKERFRDFDIRIAELSRFVSAKEAKLTKEKLAEGKVDLVIGTHALLNEKLKFNNLGLLIIDEEHKFGVSQKEQLKKIKANIHVLSLSATPIPRTLQMSLSGIKELSILANPPSNRRSVKTYVLQYDPIIIREAILREYNRGGKIFYVAPHIEDLNLLEMRIKELVPGIKIALAHAKLTSSRLDQIMNDFYQNKYDLLLSTTIIESGLDISSANTIIIHRANLLGLAELYQLRGRVGRGKLQAYAYLTINNEKALGKKARQRLEVMGDLDELGMGFSLAIRDMELRGYGNLVGEEQSGHVREIGIELYQEMLNEEIIKLRKSNSGKEEVIEENNWSPIVNLKISALINAEYINDVELRLNLYKRLANLPNNESIENFAVELIDRFGKFPEEVANLLELAKLKIICKKLHIEKVEVAAENFVVKLKDNIFPNPLNLFNYVNANPLEVKLHGDQRVIFKIKDRSKDIILNLELLLKKMLKLL